MLWITNYCTMASHTKFTCLPGRAVLTSINLSMMLLTVTRDISGAGGARQEEHVSLQLHGISRHAIDSARVCY